MEELLNELMFIEKWMIDRTGSRVPSAMYETSTCGQRLGIQGRKKVSRRIRLIILEGTSQKIGKSRNWAAGRVGTF